ncbi:beta strand repeat-containing protein [Flavobacterium sp. XGLA_31]|uniref:beta strand repeat-containing protein n=1 Tax=Flavobacterium sp. XGLA_31 TaxID=3447666 RepID=UPI003F2AAE7E
MKTFLLSTPKKINVFGILAKKAVNQSFQKGYFVMMLILGSFSVQANVGITTATGGTNISADKAANAASPAYTTLGTIVIAEGVNKDLKNGTFILSAPTGWTFNNTGVSVTGGASGSVAYTNSTTITLTISGLSNGASESFNIVGVSVRAIDGANVTAAGNITFGGGTIVQDATNLTVGTNLGSLSQTFGTMTKLLVTLPGETFTDGTTVAGSGNTGTPTAQTVGTSFNISNLRAIDQFYNVVTSYTGAKTIAYSGPGTSSGGSPTYTTSVTFASGVSTTTLATSLRKAETTTITATQGGSFGLASSSFVVNAKALTVSSPAVTSKTYDATTAATITGTLSGILSGDTVTFNGTGTFNDKNVGTGKAVTSTSTLGGTDAANYTLTQPTGLTGTITARALTITGAANSKTYDATTSSATNPTVTSGTIQSGDTAAFTQTYDTKNVGTGKTMTPSGIVTDGNSGNNYSYTFVTSTNGTITARALTITGAANSKTYDATTSSATNPTVTSGTIQSGDTAAFTQTYDNKNVGTGKTMTPTGIVTDGNSGNNYSYTFVNSTNGTITARALTITGAANSKTYDATTGSATNPTVTSGTIQSGDTAAFTQTYDTKNAGTGKTMTPTGIVTDGNSGNNYSYTFVTSTNGTITARALTITGAANSKTYDGTTSSATNPTVTSGTIQSGDTAAFTQTYDTKNVGTGKTMTPSGIVTDGNSGNNYSYTFVSSTNGIITEAALTITADNASKCFGTTYTLGTTAFTTSALQAGETVGNVTLTSSGAASGAAVGSYTIVPSAATGGTFSASNYSITYTNGTLTVNALPSAPSGTDGSRCSTGTVNLSASVSGGETVDWYSAATGGTLLQSSSTSYTTPSISTTTVYYAEARNTTTGCVSATRTAVTATVYSVSVGGTVTNNQTICYGTEPGDLTLSGETGDIVKWQSATDAGFTSPTDIAETSNTLSGVTIGTLTANTYFRAVVQNNICSVAYSSSVLITVDALTVGGTVSNDQTICSGTQPADLNLSGHTGSVIKWESSLDAGFTSPTDIFVTSATLTGATIGTLTQDTYFRAVVQNGSCDTAESDSVLISVDEAPVGGSVTGGTAICAGSTSEELTLGGYTGSIVRWEYSVSPFTTWTTIANTLDTYTSGPLTQTTQFRAVIENGTCPEAFSSATTVSINTTTWSSGAWSNGAPNATTAAIISDSYTSGGVDMEACSLTVNNSATVSITSGDSVTLSGPITVGAGCLVTFNNNANLIQSGTTNTNTGAVIIKRNSSALKRLDYTLWSSPVANQQLAAFSPQTLTNRFYTYTTIDTNPAAPDYTNLYEPIDPTTNNFATAKGYLIRVPNNHPLTATVWTGQFAGVPNNGNYSFNLVDGGAGMRFNLVGNPYPSPIDATAFVGDANNSSTITGTLYFWRKTNNALSPSYCTWTLGGFVSNGEAQVFDPNDIIQTGQGFFVEGTGSGTVNFDNTMRLDNHTDQFFKNSNTTSAAVERNRIWLNATNSSGLFSQAMVGYMTNATQGVDATIDGKYINDGDIALTSLIDATPYAIQGRALPFDATDVVPLSFKANAAGNYTIALDHVDGLFTGSQEIYLRDNTTQTIHDLRAGSYNFASEAGSFTSRFELLYQMPLGVTNPVFNANQVVIYKNQTNDFVINSGNVTMATVKVFDLRGRLLVEKKGVNATQTTIGAGLANEVLLVQITSEDGITITKKVMR